MCNKGVRRLPKMNAFPLWWFDDLSWETSEHYYLLYIYFLPLNNPVCLYKASIYVNQRGSFFFFLKEKEEKKHRVFRAL